jgi:hypothetical protein
MVNTSFLNKLAQTIVQNHGNNMAQIVIVLPNKRAKVFLIEELKKEIQSTVFAPEIISVEDFIQNLSGIRSIDSIELLFEFYTVYLSITPKEKQDPFESFANWAKTVLQDFNEIDRYLLEPDKVLKYLENIKEIEHWSVDVDQRTTLIENYLAFWKWLPVYYHTLSKHLLQKGVGYQGLIYREAVDKLGLFSSNNSKTYIFGGFNALNHAEEKIVQHLLSLDVAKIYWDIDEVFLNDPQHDAGLFVRRFKATWPYYKTHPFEWIASDFAQQKNIQVIGTSKSIGQAKIIGDLIQQQSNNHLNGGLKNVAVVLGDENLLLPVLYALPNSVEALNITMGYSSKNNPAQILISKLFKTHTNALHRDAKNYVFYYKDVLDVLTHPLIEPYADSSRLVQTINKNNFTFITHKKLVELQPHPNALFDLLFKKWDTNVLDILSSISELLLQIKLNLDKKNEEEKVANAFVFSIYKVINKLITYFSNNIQVDSIDALYAIYKQIIEVAEVSFEGEPLNGLQIMGVLESRVLDFETVIISSVNEGKFPAGKSSNSFIPYDVKRELGLPTFKEKDAIYTYHFYHLLQRAKQVYLIYNTQSDSFDAGEKSRFITQLEVEKQENHHLTFSHYNPIIPTIAYEKMTVAKSEFVMNRLHEIATAGFSPSSLTAYIRNPMQFYFQRILKVKEIDEVEEDIAVNTLGTIIHATLEELYKPFLHKFLTVEDVNSCFSKIDREVTQQFKEVYKEGEIKKGRNLLAFEVAKRNVTNFLKLEVEALQNNESIKIIALEKTFERLLEHSGLPFPILIKGNVDRIEIRNGKIRIIDYKTGKVEKKNVVLSTWDGLTNDIKNDKIIQVLAYAYMFENEAQGLPIEAGILSFKNLKEGFLPFSFKVGKEVVATIDQTILNDYVEQIVLLLKEIYTASLPFEEKVN